MLTMMFLLVYLGGVLYGTADLILTCRDGRAWGQPVPQASQREAMLNIAVWPVAIPYRLIFGYDDDEAGS